MSDLYFLSFFLSNPNTFCANVGLRSGMDGRIQSTVSTGWLFPIRNGTEGELNSITGFPKYQPTRSNSHLDSLKSVFQMARGCWWYYFSKFTEFFDTFFFVMRKRYDQVSTLHVIHHGIMPVSVWWGVKFTPGKWSRSALACNLAVTWHPPSIASFACKWASAVWGSLMTYAALAPMMIIIDIGDEEWNLLNQCELNSMWNGQAEARILFLLTIFMTSTT